MATDPSQAGPTAHPPIEPAQRTPNTLPPRNAKFVGRKSELEEIGERLKEEPAIAIAEPRERAELGGSGKTALAVEFGWAQQEAFPGGVFFVDGACLSLTAELAHLAGWLGVKSEPNQRKTALRVKSHLESAPPTLLIIDGLDAPRRWYELVQNGFAPQGNCRVLLTTRSTDLWRLTPLTIEPLPADDCVRLLAKYRADAEEGGNISAAENVADWLSRLPAALVAAGAFMAVETSVSWEEFRHRLGANAAKGGSRGPAREASDQLARRAKAAFDDLLEALHPQFRSALEYAALLPQNQVVSRWLVELLDDDPSITVAKLSGQQVHPPKHVLLHLIKSQLLGPRTPGQQVLSLHEVFRQRLNELFDAEPEQRDGRLDRIVALADQRVRQAGSALKIKAARVELMPLLNLADELRDRGRRTTALGYVNGVVNVLNRLNWHLEILSALRRWTGGKNLSRFDAPTAAILLSNQAVSLSALGELKKARDLMEQALQLEQRHFHADHPALATRYSNLAAILNRLGDVAKARRHIQRAIEIEEKHFGPQHQNLILRHWWLGDIELADNRRAEACAHYRRALAIAKSHFADDHKHVQTLQKLILRHGGDAPDDAAAT